MIDTIDLSVRHYAFEGCFNFRDIGGYQGSDGRKIRWGRYFRAGRQDRMSAVDRNVIKSLSISTQIDLRMPGEIEADGKGPLSELGANYVNIPIIPEGGRDRLTRLVGDTGISGERYLAYLSFGADSWLEIFQILSDPIAHPFVVHCTAGKDRTGVATAFLLSVLGVDKTVIEEDYLLTNADVLRQVEYIEATEGLPDGMTKSEMESAVGVPSNAMVDFLIGLEREWGGPVEYLRSIGIDDQVILDVREAFLEDK
tara:strand:+ start:527 stop:1291 length:765 start_codon:yes stop_codon:yes gene_type:complete